MKFNNWGKKPGDRRSGLDRRGGERADSIERRRVGNRRKREAPSSPKRRWTDLLELDEPPKKRE